MRAVHFGAGNIGRGFIGALLDQSGYETVFVDVNEALIDLLNERNQYHVELAGADSTIEVKNVSGLNSMKQPHEVVEALVHADLVTTAVGPNILPVISKLLAEGLEKRMKEQAGPLNVIACENMIGGSEALKQHVLENMDESLHERLVDLIGFPNAAVDRIVPDQHNEDPLTVKVEPYYEWVVETPAIKGVQPEVEGITYVEDLTPYIERKLFTVNTGHAATAYLGSYYGHSTIKEAMDDPIVKEKVEGALKETGAVLIEKYGFDKVQHEGYVDKIINRFLNPDLSDEVTRVGRGPIRKLGPKDRLVRPAVEYLERVEEDPHYLVEVIAAALSYKNEADSEAKELQEKVLDHGPTAAFKDISELNANHRLVQLVEQKYKEMN
ncbi:mannitol-1-phosphate 5-dehydrogenase [Halobacillus aidingensis]|uniref:Mannitol-1-phosphate 5-dehydrogenase n=1 Tax=Halobacillus aidingensis TaxID=240303 RepID=A0A1H0FJW6_HALAD|nr:mannitol-1-phosphate 5-dehydrogenase [Halobacillus aidingensis]SDN94947.1 mannitol-1-phosphate 5-dehydrogenase [Halobacillus aidingensis]